MERRAETGGISVTCAGAAGENFEGYPQRLCQDRGREFPGGDGHCGRDGGSQYSQCRSAEDGLPFSRTKKSPGEFQNFPDDYIHHFSQSSDTGLAVNLLQEYCFIALDIFLGIVQNKGIRNKLEAWLLFFSTDDPGEMEVLLEFYPEFRTLYEEIYELCRNVEKVMEMFSKELRELDRNTVQYMIDEMQEEIDGMKRELSDKDTILNEKNSELDKRDQEIDRLKQQLKELQDTSRK